MPEPSPAAVESLFDRAAELQPDQRDAFLDAQCNGNAELRAAVEELLHFDALAQSEPEFLQSPAAGVRATLPLSTAAPASFGRYRILRICGEGGMGVVYEAEQDNPRRTVALKVIGPGLVSLEHAKRFNHEAQILGRLQHPGIAQVYDAGFVEDGRPFFAMEFIRGTPLDEYARTHGLDGAARLDLMARVCDAVQHAHDRGVIHRDLKPGNILVDESGQPKVVDFGVARVTAADLSRTANRTQTGQLLGTLSYMSPEQIAADPSGLDARSDVYALGVILFELLAHRLPYNLAQLPVHEVARVIQQQEPSRLGSVDPNYRGDVEIIVAKALEKEKTRRYASARDFATDIRRYLQGEAIIARPASALYQFRKFARRNKTLVGGVIGVMAALVLGLIGTLRFAVQAEHSAETARNKEIEARYQTYRARIAAASAALADHDVTDAAHQLDEAPPELHGWEWHHLRSRLDDSSAMFSVQPGEITHLVRGPDGLRVATHMDQTTHLLDLEGRELFALTFPDLKSWVSLDLLASRPPRIVRRGERTIEVADRQGHMIARLPGLAGMNPAPAAISLDGSKLALGWSTSSRWAITVQALNENDRPILRIDQPTFSWSLAFSPDGSRVATAGEDGVTRVWNSTTGAKVAECRGHRSKVLHVSFRPDGKRLLTTSADGTVRQWDPANGHEVVAPYEHHAGEVMTAAYSSDGQWVASGGTDRTVRVWRADDRQDRVVLHGHTAFIKDLAFDTEGRRVVSTSSSFGSQGNDGDSTVRVWDLSDDALPVLRGHTSYVYPATYSPDGRWIATGSWDHTVRLWDAETGEPCATLLHKGTVRALAFGPDSSWLVSTSDGEERLQVWDVATARRRSEIEGTGKFAIAVAISPDGSQVASADQYGAVSASTIATGTNSVSLSKGGQWRAKTALAYSPDGRRLASTSDDLATIAVWDAHSHQRIGQFEGHTGPVYSVAFSADGQRLASASSDHTVRVWNVDNGKCVAVLRGHTDEVLAAVFHPDGTRLASAGRDRAVWLWDLATGQEVARLTGHTDYVFSLAFSPDGESLISGSGDGTARVWDTLSRQKHQQARREAEALRPDAERRVKELIRTTKGDATAVAGTLRTDPALNESQRHAAFRDLLRRSRPAASSP
jgi:WD40 repeat protein/predicted Ser/Thr protein kinase